MGIRFEYGAALGGIGGVAAYASGRGKAKQRQSKYMTDMLRDNQRAMQRQAMAAQQNIWANERDERRNKFYLDRDEARDEVRATERDTDAFRESKGFTIRPVPRDIPEKDRTKFEGMRGRLQETLRLLERDDDDQIDDFDANLQGYNAAIDGYERPSLNDEIKYYDPILGKEVDEHTPGRTLPFTGDRDFLPDAPEAPDTSAADEKREKAQQKLYDKYDADYDKWYGKVEKIFNENRRYFDKLGTSTEPWDPKKQWDDAVNELDATRGEKQPTLPPGYGAPSTAPGAPGAGGGSVPEMTIRDDGTFTEPTPVAPAPSAPGTVDVDNSDPETPPVATPTPVDPPPTPAPAATVAKPPTPPPSTPEPATMSGDEWWSSFHGPAHDEFGDPITETPSAKPPRTDARGTPVDRFGVPEDAPPVPPPPAKSRSSYYSKPRPVAKKTGVEDMRQGHMEIGTEDQRADALAIKRARRGKGKHSDQVAKRKASVRQKKQKPLPQAAPKGSVWIDSNTIRLPDGTIKRRKRGR